MARGQQPALDGRPGSLPEVRADASGSIYVMTPPGAPKSGQLTIRCDLNGELWIALRTDGDLAESDLSQ